MKTEFLSPKWKRDFNYSEIHNLLGQHHAKDN